MAWIPPSVRFRSGDWQPTTQKKLADHSKLAALCPYCLSWYYLYIAPTERLYTIYRRIPGPWYTIVYHHIPLHIPSVAVHIVSMQHLKHSIPIVACLVKYLKSRLLLVMYCHVYMHICIYIYMCSMIIHVNDVPWIQGIPSCVFWIQPTILLRKSIYNDSM